MRNLVIEINKDIDRYQESVAMGLTAKQLIFSIASVVIGGGLVYLLYPFICQWAFRFFPYLDYFK